MGGDGRPQKKRLKMSEFDENRELSLQFSPRKSKRQALADVSSVSSAAIGSPDKMTVSLPGSLGVYTTPSVCEALGLPTVHNKSLPLDEGSSDQTKCSPKRRKRTAKRNLFLHLNQRKKVRPVNRQKICTMSLVIPNLRLFRRSRILNMKKKKKKKKK